MLYGRGEGLNLELNKLQEANFGSGIEMCATYKAQTILELEVCVCVCVCVGVCVCVVEGEGYN